MKQTKARLATVHIGTRKDMSKQPRDRVLAEIKGLSGDNHYGLMRIAYENDIDPEGTERRNDRQWSAVSLEELEEISSELALERPLNAEDLGANLCISGVGDLSKLPRGSRLKFPSGAALVVEAYNPPCSDMAEKIVELYRTADGAAISARDFIVASRKKRGLVGVVDVEGEICAGDEITIEIYKAPGL